MRSRWMIVGALLLAAGAGRSLSACGADSSGAGGGADNNTPGTSRDAGSGGGGSFADVGAAPLPPEMEEVRAFELPQAGARYVYVANPRRDSVAVIDSRTLAIQTVEAGDGPTHVATIPGRDVALVVNVNAHSLSVLRTVDGQTRGTQLPVVRGANAIAVAPNGQHAVVWLDTNRPNQGVPAGSFQDVTLLTLTEGMERAVQLSVGFRPLDVVFAQDGSAAFVVTEDGISILRFADITGPTIVPGVSLGSDGTLAPADGGVSVDSGLPMGERDARPLDVAVTPDGRFAIARVEGSRWLRLIDLQARRVELLDAGGAITDVDLAADGRTALVVVRERSRVLRVPVPGGFRDPAMVNPIDLPGELVGSVAASPDGRRALLYTTVSAVERVTLLDLAGDTAPAVIRLRKTVRAVAFAPDGRAALIVHGRTTGDPNEANLDLETRIDRSYGFTLVDTATRFAKLQLTPAEVGPFALSADGNYAFVLLRNDTARVSLVERILLRSFEVQDITLGSPPTSVGTIPATQRAFVGQDHPEGRITFIDEATGALQSVTGFELNSRIVE